MIIYQTTNKQGLWDSKGCALILIDYQPEMFKGIYSSNPKLELNVYTLAKAARSFGIPVVLSTVAVEMGVNSPTMQSLQDAIPDVKPILSSFFENAVLRRSFISSGIHINRFWRSIIREGKYKRGVIEMSNIEPINMDKHFELRENEIESIEPGFTTY